MSSAAEVVTAAVALSVTVVGGLATYPRWLAPLVGGYYRAVPGADGRYYFLTRRAAERHPGTWGASIDPYLRQGVGPVTSRPGLLVRRHLGGDTAE